MLNLALDQYIFVFFFGSLSASHFLLHIFLPCLHMTGSIYTDEYYMFAVQIMLK